MKRTIWVSACLVTVLITAGVHTSFASHLMGDEFTYRYLGDSSSGSMIYHRYLVTLNIYEDCEHGQPEAIAEDNPAYLAVYDGSTLYRSDSVFYSSSTSIPISGITPCGTIMLRSFCVLRKTFVKYYALRASINSYTVSYTRCCKNGALSNIVDPYDIGSAYFCVIPPHGTNNTSAVFTNYPPLEVGINTPFVFDHSATDADGDSLSYEICNSYKGASSTNIKPFPPDAPPFTPNAYVSGLSFSNPVTASIPFSIDPLTGMLTGTPNDTGCYLVSVCCHEWRGGVMVNTSQREFELVVVPSDILAFHPTALPDTTIFTGDDVHFIATGATTFTWTPGTYLSSTSIPNPVGHFTTAGSYRYVVYGISSAGCPGYDTVRVNVLDHADFTAPNAFTPNGDGHNDFFFPFPRLNATPVSFKVFNKQKQILFSSEGGSGGWDGTFKGAKLPMDVYGWQVVYMDNKGVTRTASGNVTLVR
jgi:gliding motility-associated-like protein